MRTCWLAAITRSFCGLVSRSMNTRRAFIHAKMFTSDDEKAVVGTINLDFRSLYLHFECASYFFRNAVVMDVEEDFQKTLAKSERIYSGKLPEVSVYPAVCGERHCGFWRRLM